MAIFAPDATLDAMLDTIADNITKVVICSTQPTTYNEANVTYKLGEIAITPGDGNGDLLISNGDVSGRKLTVLQQTGVPISASGTAQHIALLDTVNSVLKTVTTCTSQSVTNGNTATINPHDSELRDYA
jgi:hypothetical protein